MARKKPDSQVNNPESLSKKSEAPLRIFIGFDHRQPVAYNILQYSIISRCSKPVCITPLVIGQLPINREGLTPFTFTRFLVPWLCDYEGWSLFLDCDMLSLSDISKLFDLKDDKYDVMVSKNNHRFEWSSLMLFNCSKLRKLTPEFIEKAEALHTINWAEPSKVGDLPREWNHLVGYDEPKRDAKIVHFTQGMPCYPETGVCESAGVWKKEQEIANSIWPWVELMGRSVHVAMVNGQLIPKFLIDSENKKPRKGYEEFVRKLCNIRPQKK